MNRDRFEIHPILLIRPWEEDNLFIKLVEEDHYPIIRIPVAIKQRHEGTDYFRVARCALYLYRILSEGNYQLVHTNGYFADIIATPICKFLNIKHISTCHGFISNDSNLRVYNKLDKFMLRFCDRIFTVSLDISNDLMKNGIEESRIAVIQNAVKSMYKQEEVINRRSGKRQFLSIGEEEFIIGYAGRLSKEKGVRYLIEAAALMRDQGETCKIIILGDGPARRDLEDLARSKSLDREIIFAGFCDDIDEWLPALDVFVLPSVTEGTPMALLEAMSMGIPVVASAVGGVPKVVEDGMNGFLTPPGDFRGLAEKVMILKKDPELRKKIAVEGINTINTRFDVKKWCRKIEEEYVALLHGNH